MLRIAVAFASREGQTEKIAHHVARLIENGGHLVRLMDLKAHESEAGTDEYDGSILAGSIHRGKYDPALKDFIEHHLAALNSQRSALLAVSLSAASLASEDRDPLEKITRAFLAGTGWTPTSIYHVAGAVHDRRLNVLERYVLHRILEHKGVTRDPTGNTELTNWSALDEFVRHFVEKAKAIPKA